MTKKKFMQELDKYISSLSYSEKIEVFEYYEEYFNDLNLGQQDEIPSDLDPKKIAQEILLEYNINNINNKEKRKNPFSFIFIILGAILSAPITLPIIILLGFILIIFSSIGFSIILALIAALSAIAYYPFKVIYSVVFGLSSNIASLTILGTVLFIIGLLIIILPAIILVLKLILMLLNKIFTIIYSYIYKKERQTNNIYESLNDLYKINISDFPGKIEIKKANSDTFLIKHSDNIKFETNFKDGILDIKCINSIHTSFPNLELYISYMNDDIDINLNSIVGNIKIDLANVCSVDIKDVLGKVYVNTIYDDLTLNRNNNLATQYVDKNIKLIDDSDRKILINDLMGSLNIKKGENR